MAAMKPPPLLTTITTISRRRTLSLPLRYALIAAAAALLFIPFGGRAHLFDWDEINFAECAREMLMTGNWARVQIDYQPFWEKPPLFIWLQAGSMALFGVSEAAARLPNALIGIATLLVLYGVGRRTDGERVARWWVALYAASWLPHFYFKSGIIDPLFNLFIFLAAVQVFRVQGSSRKVVHGALAGLCLGLAVLTKGPVAPFLLAVSFAVLLIMQRGRTGVPFRALAAAGVVTVLVSALWIAPEVAVNGWSTVRDFWVYMLRLAQTEDADHGGPFFYHFIVLLVGCFPASAFLFSRVRGEAHGGQGGWSFEKWMWILGGVTLLTFSLVQTKIVHYSSLCYFPIAYLAARRAAGIEAGTIRPSRFTMGLGLGLGALIGLLISALPAVGVFRMELVPFIDDPFAVGNLLAPVHWRLWECALGLLYLSGVVAAWAALRRRPARALRLLVVVQLFAIVTLVVHFTPKIEGHSQRAAIRFFQGLQEKNVYVHVLGYKSYAQLFYTQKLPPADRRADDEQWLLKGDIDRPAYFISKVTSEAQYRGQPGLEYLGARGGFSFFRRDPPPHAP